ncbi:MAG: extracellular solute-binding protein [Enterocloster sp.]
MLGASLTGCQSKPAETTAAETTAAETTKAETEASSEAETTKAETEAAEKPYGDHVKRMLAYGGAEAAFDAFTEKTGIKVEYVEISTGKALAQLQAENGNTTADIWFGGGVDSYISATDLGYLEQYVSPEAEAINPAYSDADGYWTGLALVPAGFLVNNDVLAEKNLEAPKTWEDLADPKYKGEIIMASPAISGTQYAILNGTIQAYGEEKGWEVWKGINENVDFYAQGGGEPGPKCAAGEFGSQFWQ